MRSQFGVIGSMPVEAFTITNAHGLSATAISYGARLTQMHVPDRNGITADIVLGFDDVASYEASDTYFGATCGRHGTVSGMHSLFSTIRWSPLPQTKSRNTEVPRLAEFHAFCLNSIRPNQALRPYDGNHFYGSLR